jgi:four helix bundle protein
MLRIYEVALRVLEELRPAVAAIEVRDRDLARQMRRAASSVVLNIAEGSGSSAGTRRERYRNALGSAREVVACIEVARAWRYANVDAGCLREVIGTLVKVNSLGRRGARPRGRASPAGRRPAPSRRRPAPSALESFVVNVYGAHSV